MSLKIEADFSSAFEQLSDITERVRGAVHPATKAGAMLVKNEVLARAPQSERAHWFYSRGSKNADGTPKKYLFQPGSLKKAIYIKFLDEQSVAGQSAAYKISWRQNSSQIGYVPYAHMVEFGTARSPAHPFLRPAFDAKKDEAERIIVAAIKEAVSGKNLDSSD